MTFQFIVEYVDPDRSLPFDFGYTDKEYDSISEYIKSKRIRAKNG